VFALMVAAAGCTQSAGERARKTAAREREEASTRESEMVRRVSTPQDPHRILYEAPDGLSDSNAIRTNATIVGVNKVPQPTEPAVQSGPPPVKPRP
jgi:ABC-type Fe3+-hydroxamate transport system substrate-binding protein